ncbi:MAG: DNA-processing protein DprA [Treponema sp.]|jgi:DNA processing protein|nr:DNA-processing protein DprA [Treponema sp.]
MNERGLLDLIIALLPGLEIRERVRLLQEFDREEDLIVRSKADIENYLGRRMKPFWDMEQIRAKAERDDMICRMRSIERVSFTDAAYPPLLREIYDPPAVVFYRGHLPDPEKPLLAMVGTRRPSPEGRAQAYAIGHGLGRAGFSVVSGLALGIDAMSHRGNLDGGAPGYAVLGSGVDEIYPSSNRSLAKRILDSGGALVSEYPPGTSPRKWNFPARNRIVSALARSVLIVEAPQCSGALITARLALGQDRDLWVASSGVRAERDYLLYDKRGGVKLAAEGAEIIYSARDVLDKWNLEIACNNNDLTALAGSVNVSGRELAASLANYLEIEL